MRMHKKARAEMGRGAVGPPAGPAPAGEGRRASTEPADAQARSRHSRERVDGHVRVLPGPAAAAPAARTTPHQATGSALIKFSTKQLLGDQLLVLVIVVAGDDDQVPPRHREAVQPLQLI